EEETRTSSQDHTANQGHVGVGNSSLGHLAARIPAGTSTALSAAFATGLRRGDGSGLVVIAGTLVPLVLFSVILLAVVRLGSVIFFPAGFVGPNAFLRRLCFRFDFPILFLVLHIGRIDCHLG